MAGRIKHEECTYPGCDGDGTIIDPQCYPLKNFIQCPMCVLLVEVERLTREVKSLQRDRDIDHRVRGEEYWIWQRDGGNELKSLAMQTPVVMRACDLRDIVDAGASCCPSVRNGRDD